MSAMASCFSCFPRLAGSKVSVKDTKGGCTLPLPTAEGKACDKCGGTGIIHGECCSCGGVVDVNLDDQILKIGDEDDSFPPPDEVMSMGHSSFEWTVSPSSIRNAKYKECITSETFKLAGSKFKFRFWPRGKVDENKSSLTLFLDAPFAVTLQAELRINDHARHRDQACEIAGYGEWGFPQFGKRITEADVPVVISIVLLQLPGKTKPEWPIPKDYELIGVLGKGTYGCVCKAWNSKQQQHVAIKEIKHVFEGDEETSKRIVREVGIMAKLQHPCILNIYCAFNPNPIQSDTLYVVMELCHTDLKKLACNDTELKLPQVRRLAYNLVLGCEYLHSKRIYHRDLKPANCLANRDCSVKICDFNHARIVEAEVGTPRANAAGFISRVNIGLSRTPTDVCLGTKEFNSPEYLLKVGYTQKADVWAVGCIFVDLFRATQKSVKIQSGLFNARRERARKQHLCHEKDGLLDQIFDVIGTPFDEQKRHLFECLPPSVQSRLRGCYPAREGSGLASQVPSDVPDEAVLLLTRLITFFPCDRLSMTEVLAHPFFECIHQKSECILEAEACQLEVAYDESCMSSESEARRAMQHILDDARANRRGWAPWEPYLACCWQPFTVLALLVNTAC